MSRFIELCNNLQEIIRLHHLQEYNFILIFFI